VLEYLVKKHEFGCTTTKYADIADRLPMQNANFYKTDGGTFGKNVGVVLVNDAMDAVAILKTRGLTDLCQVCVNEIKRIRTNVKMDVASTKLRIPTLCTAKNAT
jgi:hypothetical protein